MTCFDSRVWRINKHNGGRGSTFKVGMSSVDLKTGMFAVYGILNGYLPERKRVKDYLLIQAFLMGKSYY